MESSQMANTGLIWQQMQSHTRVTLDKARHACRVTMTNSKYV